MELRVLNYFLVVAREENITKAANLLHMTQPTLSRQLKQLEEELGVELFHRGRYNVSLTEDGLLLQRRAREIMELSEKTKLEFEGDRSNIAGEITIGCGETHNMAVLSSWMSEFRKQCPLVHFQILSAGADTIMDGLENGLVDIGLLMEPVSTAKCEVMRMPCEERWGLLMRDTDPLSKKKSITPKDLVDRELILPRREIVQEKVKEWAGTYYDSYHIAATNNLFVNATFLVDEGVGMAITFDLITIPNRLKFVPMQDSPVMGAVLAWKREAVMSNATREFLQYCRNAQ